MDTDRIFSIDSESELRFFIDHGQIAIVTLLEGAAEIFSTDLTKNQNYTFTGQSVAVFTRKGCKLQIKGNIAQEPQITKDTPMAVYMSIHRSLEQARNCASATGSFGPRVLIAGPVDSGKSTLAKMLVGFAVREHRKVIFVDLDTGQQQIAVPGSISAVIVDKPVDITEGFSRSPPPPLMYYFGHTRLTEEPGLNDFPWFQKASENLAKNVMRWKQVEEGVKSGGLIINTCGWVKDQGYEMLLHSVRTFDANLILVPGDKDLHSRLTQSLKDTSPHIEIQLIPKSSGVITRDTSFRGKTRSSKFKEHFYGPLGNRSPHVFVIPFSELSIFRVSRVAKAPRSPDDQLKLEVVTPTSDLT